MRTWRWAQMGRATRHRERHQTRCSLQPASVWGTASTGGSPWRWGSRTATLITEKVYAASPHSTPHPLTSASALLFTSWEIWGYKGGVDCSPLNGLSVSELHDTDSSPAPWGPQQQRLVKRCSVIICAVTAVIFYMSDLVHAGIGDSYVPLATAKCIIKSWH